MRQVKTTGSAPIELGGALTATACMVSMVGARQNELLRALPDDALAANPSQPA
jgi:hypothetical protein